MPPGEKSHVPVRLIRESSKMFVARIPFDDERNVFVLLPLQRVDVAHASYGLFAAEVLLNVRYQAERKYLHLCTARPILSLVVPVSTLSSMSLQVELKSHTLPD